MDRRFAPKAPRFGVMPDVTSASNLTNITASATTTYYIPVPGRKAYVERLSFSTVTVPTGSSTILATWKKFDVAGNTDISLNVPVNGQVGTGDIKSMVTKNNHIVTISTTNSTDKDRILQPADTLRVDIVAAGTVTAQPVNLCLNAEILVLE